MEQIYNLVGQIIENAQYLEYNLIMMIKYDKILSIFKNNQSVNLHDYEKVITQATSDVEELKHKTLGEIIYTINAMNTLSEEELTDLEKVLKTRNYLVHRYFKEKDFDDNPDLIIRERGYLTNTLNRMQTLNLSVANVINYQQEVIKSIK